MGNVLVIGDLHAPFEHKNYLNFCKSVKKRFNCSLVIYIGDLVDNHAISFHDSDPDGWSAKDEMEKAKKTLKKWYKAFPEAMICKGNHDRLTERKAKSIGLPKSMIKSFEEVWDLPSKYKYEWNYTIDNVLYTHGDGFSGLYPHVKACTSFRQNTVIGHLHSVAGVYWTASQKDIIFGMSVGCGIDWNRYSFEYQRFFKRKPILSCGVVTDRGRNAQVIPMAL